MANKAKNKEYDCLCHLRGGHDSAPVPVKVFNPGTGTLLGEYMYCSGAVNRDVSAGFEVEIKLGSTK